MCQCCIFLLLSAFLLNNVIKNNVIPEFLNELFKVNLTLSQMWLLQ